MKTLILMRHAKSDWMTGESDHRRPLNPRGRHSAAAIGRWLRTIDVLPDVALVSDAVRTTETWELLALPGQPIFDRTLYHASVDVMLGLIRQQTSADTLLVLAHNPDIAELANRLVVEPPDNTDFEHYPTASTTILTFETEAWNDVAPGAGRLKAFQTPRPLLA